MRFLAFDVSDSTEGVTTLEALASVPAEHHAAVMAEVRQVLDWAWRHFPHSHGPADDGMDWDDDLQVTVEDGRWHAVTLTLTGSAGFAERFLEAFGGGQEG